MEQNDFEELFHNHYKFLCLISDQILDDWDVSKDLVQEFYINFWNRRESVQLSGSFQAYAARAVKNLSISYLRKKQSVEAKNGLMQFEESFDPQVEADEWLNKENLDNKIKASIDKLPKECRSIFLLHNQDGLSYAQIAERNNISINTVKTQMKRAYAFLRTELSEQAFVFLILYFCLSTV